MNYVMQVKRGRDGLEAETRVPLGFDRRELRITTGKGSRGVYTGCQVVQVAADGLGFSFLMYGDFGKVLNQDKAARATEKTIRTMHASALVGVDAVVADVMAFYGQKVAA